MKRRQWKEHCKETPNLKSLETGPSTTQKFQQIENYVCCSLPNLQDKWGDVAFKEHQRYTLQTPHCNRLKNTAPLENAPTQQLETSSIEGVHFFFTPTILIFEEIGWKLDTG
jgi:hypothetical protein